MTTPPHPVFAVSSYDARQLNLAAVLELVRERPGQSRSELHATMPFSRQTMTNVVQELLDMDILREEGRAANGRRGNPHRGLWVRPEAGHALGLQVFWTSCRIVLVDLSLKVVAEKTYPLDVAPGDVAAYLDALGAVVAAFLEAHPGKDVWSVGVAGPLAIEGATPQHRKRFELSGLDIGWFRRSLFETGLEDRLGLPVRIVNNPQAAALAQAAAFPARARFAMVLVGMGLGASFVSARSLSRDIWPHGGELGHVQYRDEPLNTVLSAAALQRALGIDLPADRIEDDLARMAGEAPERFEPWLAQAAPILRFLVNFVEAAFWPDGIVLGGFLPRAVLVRLRDHALPLTESVVMAGDDPERLLPRVSVAEGGGHAIAFGAALTVLSYRQNRDLPQLLAARRRPQRGI